MRPGRILIASLLLAGCMSEPAGIERSAPDIEVAAVEANPHNVLSAIVRVRVRHADHVAVRFGLAGSTEDSLTPAVPLASDSVSIPVLGLLPDQRYSLRVVADGPGGSTLGEPLDLTTGSLPFDLPRYTASGTNPTPGYVVFGTGGSPGGGYGLVIDNTGRIVWYRRFPNGPGLAFMAQPNGRYVTRPPTPDPTDIEPWFELDALGNVTRTMSCARSLQPRLHDLIGEPGGGYWILCDETRTMDLTASGGVAAARVTGTAVQHVSSSGELLFHWSPFDHFAITDVDPAERTGVSVNWTHGNALDFDPDGNLILSFRNLGEITKIDPRTGNVIWRLGGRRNQFTFLDTPMPAFYRQHNARAYARDAVLLLDNLGNPSESRAERYALDETARTARLMQSFGATPGAVTEIGGSVQDLPGGRTLVSYGTAGRVEEYDAARQVVWRITGGAGYVFRAQRISSLYAPGVGTTR
jgi:hypothetical protein